MKNKIKKKLFFIIFLFLFFTVIFLVINLQEKKASNMDNSKRIILKEFQLAIANLSKRKNEIDEEFYYKNMVSFFKGEIKIDKKYDIIKEKYILILPKRKNQIINVVLLPLNYYSCGDYALFDDGSIRFISNDISKKNFNYNIPRILEEK